jgi:glucosylceramidase
MKTITSKALNAGVSLLALTLAPTQFSLSGAVAAEGNSAVSPQVVSAVSPQVVSAVSPHVASAVSSNTASATSTYIASAASSSSHDASVAAHDVTFTTTSPDKRLVQSDKPLHWMNSQSPISATITIDSNKKYQKILGFGGAFTDATCYTFNQMPAEARQKLFQELFASDQLGLNVCRTCMGSSDYSTKVYSYDDGEVDPELKRFSIALDRDYIVPMLKQALKSNPNIFLFATPWSPPGWMKSSKSMLGGNMRKEYMRSYAEYFVKFLRAYESEGVPIRAVTIQNEVDTDQDGRMPACSWPQEYEADFAGLHLGPTLKKADLKTQIWLIDHNYNLWGRAIGELEVPEVRKYASGIAWHGYMGNASNMTRVHDAFPDINAYWTEGGPDYTAKDYTTDWTRWSQNFTEIFRNWSRSVTAWNIALDEVGKPNLGPFPCGGIVTVNSRTHDVTRSGQYYALAQFSKFVKRDAVRIDSQGELEKISHVAFQNPDGKYVLVVSNSGEAKPIQIKFDDKVIDCQLDQNSVTTLTWQ